MHIFLPPGDVCTLSSVAELDMSVYDLFDCLKLLAFIRVKFDPVVHILEALISTWTLKKCTTLHPRCAHKAQGDTRTVG